MAVFRSLLCKGRRPFRCGSPWTVATLHRHTPLLLRHERIIKIIKIIFKKKKKTTIYRSDANGEKTYKHFFPFSFVRRLSIRRLRDAKLFSVPETHRPCMSCWYFDFPVPQPMMECFRCPICLAELWIFIFKNIF